MKKKKRKIKGAGLLKLLFQYTRKSTASVTFAYYVISSVNLREYSSV